MFQTADRLRKAINECLILMRDQYKAQRVNTVLGGTFAQLLHYIISNKKFLDWIIEDQKIKKDELKQMCVSVSTNFINSYLVRAHMEEDYPILANYHENLGMCYFNLYNYGKPEDAERVHCSNKKDCLIKSIKMLEYSKEYADLCEISSTILSEDVLIEVKRNKYIEYIEDLLENYEIRLNGSEE